MINLANHVFTNHVKETMHPMRQFPALVPMCFIAGFVLAQPKSSLGPPPGVLIDLGDHKLHIHCLGPENRQPAVIFEAGGGDFSKSWEAVQSRLASTARTCAHDRAGLGWSEPGASPRTMAQEVFELHSLLNLAGIRGSLILVGQSIGALNVRLYAEQYPNEVVGVVLVDPTDESSKLFNLRSNRWIRLREQGSGRVVPSPRRTGPLSSGYKPEDDYLGEEAQAIYLRRKRNSQPFGDRPLIVLAAGKRPPPPGMTEESFSELRREKDQERVDAANLSRNSKFILDSESGHHIQTDNPELVQHAVQDVVKAVVGNARLAH